MDPFITAIVLTAIIVGGGLGSIVINRLFDRFDRRADNQLDDPQVEELLEGQRLLEARIEQMEEELKFLTALNSPERAGELPVGGSGDETH